VTSVCRNRTRSRAYRHGCDFGWDGPRRQLAPEAPVGHLDPVSFADQPHDPGAVIAAYEIQLAALVASLGDERVSQVVPNDAILESLAVAVALPDHAKQRVLVKARRIALLERHASQQILVPRVRQNFPLRAETEMPGRDVKRSERRSTADDQSAVIRIDDQGGPG
jgi:hypothetical protein